MAQAPPSASPSPSSEADARAHFDRGVSLFSNHDYEGALAEFLAAYEIGGRPIVLFNIATTQRELHHYREAARAIEQYLQIADLPRERREALQAALTELQTFIGHVSIAGAVPGTSVRVDSEVVTGDALATPIAVSTGRHEIEATAAGYEPFRTTVVVAGGQSRVVSLEMRPIPSAALPTPEPSTLLVHATPAAAIVEIDGAAASLDRDTAIAPGIHVVRAHAPDRAPAERTLRIAAGAHVTMRAHLERTGSGPIALILGASATVALAIASGVAGGVTLDTYNQFRMLTRSDPRARDLSSRGSAEETATNVLLTTTIIAAAATVFIAVLPRFRPTSAIDVAVVPDATGGATGFVRARF